MITRAKVLTTYPALICDTPVNSVFNISANLSYEGPFTLKKELSARLCRIQKLRPGTEILGCSPAISIPHCANTRRHEKAISQSSIPMKARLSRRRTKNLKHTATSPRSGNTIAVATRLATPYMMRFSIDAVQKISAMRYQRGGRFCRVMFEQLPSYTQPAPCRYILAKDSSSSLRLSTQARGMSFFKTLWCFDCKNNSRLQSHSLTASVADFGLPAGQPAAL